MTAEGWNKAKALFEAALEQEPSQRATFLAQNCPDDGLRHEVEKLLINFQEAGSFLSNPAFHPKIDTPNEISEVRAEGESPSVPARSGQPLSTVTAAGTDDPMIGRHLGVYELKRRVGQGGMAAVFLAGRADGEYRQQVAIKLLLPGLEKDEILGRFRKERQTLAGLDHPNIVKLLDGGSTPEGLPYLVMDYVEGSPIDKYCDSHKLSIDQRLRLFGKVCEAVQHAHQKLVIHRDLKPGNILVTANGVPKLLDFGIAKVLEPTEELLALTQTGARCMTPAFASPEQVRGKSVTAATDIYSLGAVLYELLSGHRPYQLKEHTASEMERVICEQEPETPSAAVNRVESETSSDGTTVTKTPEVVSQTREGQPERLRRRLRGDLDNIVLKALQKEPERRYSSVEEFWRDIDRHLRRVPVKARRSTLTYRASRLVQRHKIEAGAASVVLFVLSAAAGLTLQVLGHRDRLPGSPSMPIRSLAVLPLTNISGDSAQEYLSDEVTDAVITDLAEIGSLKVISRTSTAQYKKTDKRLPKIARELNVDAIVTGTVQRSGDRVRITAQLIHGLSDKHLWANSYERDIRDVFMLEREVTSDIAHRIQAQLATENQPPATQRRPINLTALEAYLQGNYHLNRGVAMGPRDEELRKAGIYFQHAINADPGFAPAYIGLAKSHDNVQWPSSDDLEIMTKAAEKAIALDPASSDAHGRLGLARFYERDWSGAEREYRRAIALSPNSASAHSDLGGLLDTLGHLEEGWNEHEIAQQLDPNHDQLSQPLYLRGQYDRAIELLIRTAEASPDDGVPHWLLSQAYMQKGMHPESVQELVKCVTLYGFPELATRIQRAFASSGWQGEVLQWAKELEQLIATKRCYFPGVLAQVYAQIGDNDRAFYWLEQVFAHWHLASISDPVVGSVKTDPSLASLRADPRFNDFLRRMRLLP
jgi:serine/threonine protein kinase/tetratricopeptide (TPR) repeat protein